MQPYDIAIIGGGIVGLATAYHLVRHAPDRSVIVVEKEERVAVHQTGRNSGVIHSGVFYAPGSLKARNCRVGREALVAFCEQEDVAYEMCGKVIVAITERERGGLQAIEEKAQTNGVEARRIGPEELRAIEPHTRGVAALHVPRAGIVDYQQMAKRMAERVVEQGHDVRTGAEVRGVQMHRRALTLETTAGPVRARYAVNCAGLYADRIARLCGHDPGVQIIPFRGEYYELRPEARSLCRHLIYPVPDPAFPFLGIHFTRMIDGRVECGPSAVLAFAREGYTLQTVDGRELLEILTYPGFLRLAARHWRRGLRELKQSLDKTAYLRAARRLVPTITADDLIPAPSGVRAQAVRPNGELVDDFLFVESERMVHAINVASPAATASLTIGQMIVDRLAAKMDDSPATA